MKKQHRKECISEAQLTKVFVHLVVIPYLASTLLSDFCNLKMKGGGGEGTEPVESSELVALEGAVLKVIIAPWSRHPLGGAPVGP